MNTITDFRPEAVIVDAGQFPENSHALRWLDGCRRTVCCDGAADRFAATGRPIWRIVGDCDSLSPETRSKYSDIIRYNPDQETNDQTKAVEYLRKKGMTRVVILGATGWREDHTLGNISLLISYLKEGTEARIYTDYGVFIPVEGDREFFCRPGTQVSIFSFGASGLRSEGLRYPVRDFDSLWQGTLNETLGDRFRIHAEGYWLIFINY